MIIILKLNCRVTNVKYMQLEDEMELLYPGRILGQNMQIFRLVYNYFELWVRL